MINMKITVTIALIAVCLTSLCVGAAQFTRAEPHTLIVPDDYPTINAALGGAINGDTIFVRNGIYNETLTVNKAVSLIGENRETTIINGQITRTVLAVQHDNVNVTGFTVVYGFTPYHPQSIWMWSTRLAGIHLLSVKNCSISGNKVSDCGAGIWLYDSHQNVVSGNILSNNDYGMRIEASTNNTLTSNTVTGNWGGIRLLSTSGNKLAGNYMSSNTQNLGISNEKLAFSADEVDSSNRVDGKPVYYWIGASDRDMPGNAGYVVLVNCTNIQVRGLSLSKNQEGMILAHTQNVTVSGNCVTECTTGIIMYDSSFDTVVGNDLRDTSGIVANGTGTRITNNLIAAQNVGIGTGGAYQTIANNTVSISQWQGYMIRCSGAYTNITRNTLAGTSYAYTVIEGPDNVFYENMVTDSYGLRVTSDRNLIAKNNVTGGSISVSGTNNTVCTNILTNGFGLTVAGHYNRYFANLVQDNTQDADTGGLEAYSSDNTIYQNNFVGNEQQIKNYDNKGNFWDNGVQGNFWSDYNGTDQNRDGIGDQPYIIMGLALNNEVRSLVPIVTGQDNYPLMMPFDISSVTVEFPEWVHATPTPPSSSSEPNPPLTTNPSPTQTATPTATASPTEAPTAKPTLAASPSTSATPQPTPSPTNSTPIVANNNPDLFNGGFVFILVAVVGVTVAVGAELLFRKKRKPNLNG
jgi:parallel beta-helix repeat protein